MNHAAAISFEFRRSLPQSAMAAGPAAVVSEVLEAPDDSIDYASTKITFDSLIDPDFDADVVRTQLDRLTEAAWSLAGGSQRPDVRLGAVRRLLYEAGPWNDDRPFAYDQSDPDGRLLRNKLLHNCLRTRLGQCVSMPILFLILARRLRLSVALASAPEHVFVRYTDEAGRTHNLETTSGGHPARNRWYRETFPVTDVAVESGVYLRTLTPREGLVVMASTVLEHLSLQHRHEEVMDVANVMLRHHPLDIHALLHLGSAAGRLLDQISSAHPNPYKAPPDVRARATKLMEQNRDCFARAERLGWVPFE